MEREDVVKSFQFLGLKESDISELNTIKLQVIDPDGHLRDLNEEISRLSSKLDKAKGLTYSIELSKKDPLDVEFGNDGGCCIGVYPPKSEEDSEGLGNAFGLPHIILDNATYIFNVNQFIGTGRSKRVGIVLAFEGRDTANKRVLICNSLEMSPFRNPEGIIPQVVNYVEKGLAEFCNINGFDQGIMSDHPHNTSKKHSSNRMNAINPTKLRKLSISNEPQFYSEVFDSDGMIKGSFYEIFIR